MMRTHFMKHVYHSSIYGLDWPCQITCRLYSQRYDLQPENLTYHLSEKKYFTATWSWCGEETLRFVSHQLWFMKYKFKFSCRNRQTAF